MLPSQNGKWVYFDYVPGEPDIRTGAAGVTGRLCVIGAEVDDDTASVKVKYSYVDLSKVDFDEIDDFVENIKDADDKKNGKFTLKFDVDDDEYLVSNADDVVGDFFDTVSDLDLDEPSAPVVTEETNEPVETEPAVSEIEVPDDEVDVSYTIMVYGDAWEIAPDEEMTFSIECMEFYPEVNDKKMSYSLEDESGKVLYKGGCTFVAGTTYTFDIAPKDCGVDSFASGTYTFTAKFDGYDYSDYDTVDVVAGEVVETEPKETEETKEPETTEETEKTEGSEVEEKPEETEKTEDSEAEETKEAEEDKDGCKNKDSAPEVATKDDIIQAVKDSIRPLVVATVKEILNIK